MIHFQGDERHDTGYLAMPSQGEGPGVLVLHAWWGLNDTFKRLCDRLAGEGFVALAPDLYGGEIAHTSDEALALLKKLDFKEAVAEIKSAIAYLQQVPTVRSSALGVIGFSMGAALALLISTERPEDVVAVAAFYGTEPKANYSTARAAYLLHYAETDEWEPDDEVRAQEEALRAAGREAMFFTYPGTKHWFFEEEQSDAYDAQAARIAWERTLDFLRLRLGTA